MDEYRFIRHISFPANPYIAFQVIRQANVSRIMQISDGLSGYLIQVIASIQNGFSVLQEFQ